VCRASQAVAADTDAAGLTKGARHTVNRVEWVQAAQSDEFGR
jgi:hypothetical protein